MTPFTWTDWALSLLPTVILLLLWLIPVLAAFSRLQKHTLEETAKAVWVLIILILPIIGAITYIMLGNRKHDTDK